jgi:glycine/D-amino acid oxidase-like deaminating enzyme
MRTSKIHAETHGLWARSAPPLETFPLYGSATAEVIVIGAGYTGLSTALHLSELGVSVAVMESEDVGFGGSGRNVGLVNAGLWVRPTEVVRALGENYGTRLLHLLGAAPSLVFEIIDKYGIQCATTRSGTLHCAVGRKGLLELEQRHAQWSALGAPVE